MNDPFKIKREWSNDHGFILILTAEKCNSNKDLDCYVCNMKKKHVDLDKWTLKLISQLLENCYGS